MRNPSLDYHPAYLLPLGELTLLWREVYANYPVPLPFTEDELERFISMSAIDLELSLVAVANNEPVGLSFVAATGAEAWIGGFGVIESHRRSGIGLALMRRQCRVLELAGVTETRLEVMTTNRARRLYTTAGFVDRRRLVSFNSPAMGVSADPLVVLQPEQLPGLHRRLHHGVSAAPWQRSETNVMRALMRDRLTLLGWRSCTGIAAYAVEQNSGGVCRLIDVAAENSHAAEAIIASIATRVRGRRLYLGDEPADSPISLALRRFGAAPRTQRYEMMRLSPPTRNPLPRSTSSRNTAFERCSG